MATFNLLNKKNLESLFPFTIVFIGSLSIGILSSLFSPFWALAGIAALAFLLVLIKKPEIGLLGYLIITSTIIDGNLLPKLPIGVGRLLITDIVLLAFLGLIIVRTLLAHDFRLVQTPLDFPLLGFVGIAFLSTFIAIIQSRLTFHDSLGEIRNSMSYLTFFIVTNLIRNEKQLRRLYGGIVFLAIFVALAMIAQSVLGSSIQVLPGRVETLWTAEIVSYGVTRVLPPGQSLVLIVFICVLVQILFDKKASRSIIYLIQFGIVGLAVILTFTRSFWVTCVLALALVGILVSLKDKVKFFKIVLGIVLIGALILAPFLAINKGGEVQKVITGFTVRVSSLFTTNVTRENSLNYRYIENGYAYPQIASHPFIGLGFGVSYRPVDERIMATTTTYLHNGHLWVMLKTGLIGYLLFILFLLIFVIRALQNWRMIRDPILKGIVLSFSTTIVGLMVAAIVFSIFRDDYWTPVIGVMLGMGEVVLRITHDTSLDVQAAEKLV